MNIPVITPAFGWVIGKIYSLCGQNYMLALVLFAVLVKLLLFPFGIKQQKNSIRQAKLRPMETAIRKKYAGRDDKATQQKCQQEIMDLYQQENYNPMSGCLPMLIQMPILFGLYSVIVNPLTYVSGLGKQIIDVLTDTLGLRANYDINIIRAITDMGPAARPAFLNTLSEKLAAANITDTTAADIVDQIGRLPTEHFSVFGIDLTVNPTYALNWYLIIPVLTFVFAFFSTKIIRKFTYQPQTTADQAGSLAMMDWTMPLLSVYICFQVPSAIAIYWMIQNVLSAVQQIALHKMYPIPEVTEEELREAELKIKGRAAEKKASGGKTTLPEPDENSPIYEAVPDVDFDDRSELRVASRKRGLTEKMKKRLRTTKVKPRARRKI